MLTTHRVLPMPETRPTPLIAGVDEAGRGPLAGPVVCAAVVLPANFSALDQLDDSKKLSEKRRAALSAIIRAEAELDRLPPALVPLPAQLQPYPFHGREARPPSPSAPAPYRRTPDRSHHATPLKHRHPY